MQSKFLAVGSVVPWAEPDVGAVATQSYANPRYGPDGLALLRQGLSAEEVVKRLTEADDGRDQRQLGVVDAAGRRRDVHGRGLPRLGGRPRRAPGYAAQGNILVSGETVDALAETFEATRGLARRAAAGEPRARRRRRAATAAASSRPRCSSSSATAATRASRTSLVDLRVDDHEAPIEELRRLYGLHDQLFGKTPRDQWLPVDDELRAEIDERLATLGYERLEDWAGAANLEERVDGDARDRPGRAARAEEETMSGYEIASLTELESVPAVGTLRWTPLRKHFGITAFGINAYTATEAGQDVVEEHDEERLGHEELYVVVAGRATFVLDGEEMDVPAGSLVFLRDPKVKRYARAEEPGTTVLAIGGKPGAARVSAWEYFFTAYRASTRTPTGRSPSSRRGLAEKPDHPALHYHLACIYAAAAAGSTRRGGALDRALELDPESSRSGPTRTRTWLPLRVAGQP